MYEKVLRVLFDKYLLKYWGQVPRKVLVTRTSLRETGVGTQARLSPGARSEGSSSKN